MYYVICICICKCICICICVLLLYLYVIWLWHILYRTQTHPHGQSHTDLTSWRVWNDCHCKGNHNPKGRMKTAIFRWVNYAIIDNSAQIWHIYITSIYIYTHTLTSYIYIYLLHMYIYINHIYRYMLYMDLLHIYYMCLWTTSTHTDIWSKSRATAAGAFPGSHSYGEQMMIYWSTRKKIPLLIHFSWNYIYMDINEWFIEVIYIYMFQFSWTYLRA